MDNSTLVKTEHFCRCCLSADSNFSDMLNNTFEHEGDLLSYFHAYMALFDFDSSTIPDSFELKMQCEVCANRLKNMYTFLKTCQKNYIAFQKFIVCSRNKIDKICRCCLYDSDALSEMKDVSYLIPQIDKYINSNEINYSKICNDCLIRLEQTKVFHHICTQTNNQLTEMFGGPNILSKIELELKVKPVITVSIPVSLHIYDEAMVKKEPEIMIEDVLDPMVLVKDGLVTEIAKNGTVKRTSSPDLAKTDLKPSKSINNRMKRGTYPCSKCTKTFEFSLQFEIHQFRIHGVLCMPHETLFPFMSDEEKTNELKNWVIFPGSRHIYKCLKCRTYYTTTIRVKAHIQSAHIHSAHVNSKKYKCLQCPAAYKYNNSLTHHLKHFTHESGMNRSQ
jgi:hypothetical protein